MPSAEGAFRGCRDCVRCGENFYGGVVRALLRRNPAIDLLCVQGVGLSGADDPTVLEFAAGKGPVLLTHDVATLVGYGYARVDLGMPMAGVLEVGGSPRFVESSTIFYSSPSPASQRTRKAWCDTFRSDR